MKVSKRQRCSTCEDCKRETTHPVVYSIGAVTFSLCRYCAKRLAYYTNRELTTLAEA